MLGAAAAQLLGIDRVYPAERIWVGGQWFYLAGILKPAVLASDIDTSVLVGFPAARKYLGLRRPPVHDLPPRRHRPGQRRRQPPRRDRQPGEPQRGQRQPALRRPGRPSRRQERAERPVPRPRRRRPVGRRGRRRQHHDHLRARAPLRDRTAPRPRRHQGPYPHPVPLRGRPARTARRSRRRRAGRRGHRRLRTHQTLGDHRPRRSVGGRHRRLRSSSARSPGSSPPSAPHASPPPKPSGPSDTGLYSIAPCARCSEASGTGRRRTPTGQGPRTRRFANVSRRWRTRRMRRHAGLVSCYAIDDGARLLLVDPLAVPREIEDSPPPANRWSC